MEKMFSKPKRFAEVLDLTFRIIKEQFGKLFLLLLAFYSPIIVTQALIQVFAGRGFIRDLAPGESFFEQIINTTVEMDELFINPAETYGNLLLGLMQLIVVPIATASVILIVKYLKDNQSYEIKTIAKQAFSRFWPLVGSYLLFSIIASITIIIPIAIIGSIAAFSFLSDRIIAGLLFILLIFVLLIALLLLITRWSLFLPISLFKGAPGLSDSFHLTRGRTWMTFWLYVTLFIITGFVTSAFEIVALFLGVSVLYTIIINIVGIFTTMIFSVGYAVIYFDLDVRQTGSDLKGMINEYQTQDVDRLR